MSYVTDATCPECGAKKNFVHVGFAKAISEMEDEFPILARAIAESVPAHNPMVEWIHNGGSFSNYTEIIRTPFGMSGTQMAAHWHGLDSMDSREEEALRRHLASVEQALTYGEPSRTTDGGHIKQTCGGVRFYLGRLPRDDDTIRLRPLRDLALLLNRQAPDRDGVEHEWMSEVSVQVMPG